MARTDNTPRLVEWRILAVLIATKSVLLVLFVLFGFVGIDCGTTNYKRYDEVEISAIPGTDSVITSNSKTTSSFTRSPDGKWLVFGYERNYVSLGDVGLRLLNLVDGSRRDITFSNSRKTYEKLTKVRVIVEGCWLINGDKVELGWPQWRLNPLDGSFRKLPQSYKYISCPTRHRAMRIAERRTESRRIVSAIPWGQNGYKESVYKAINQGKGVNSVAHIERVSADGGVEVIVRKQGKVVGWTIDDISVSPNTKDCIRSTQQMELKLSRGLRLSI